MVERKYEVVLSYKEFTIIKYEKQYIGEEYVVARNFNKEEFSWDSASDNYAYSFESALAILLKRLGSDYIKSKRQIQIEEDTGITFDRACELATLFKDRIADDAIEFNESDEDFIAFFTEDCDMEENELSFFGLKTESEEDDENDNPWEEE